MQRQDKEKAVTPRLKGDVGLLAFILVGLQIQTGRNGRELLETR